MGEGLVFKEGFRGMGVSQSVLDEVAFFLGRGKRKVDSLVGATQLIDAFSELLVTGDVCCHSPVINFLSAIGKCLEMGTVAMEKDKEPLREGLWWGVFIVVDSGWPLGFGIDREGILVVIRSHGGLDHGRVYRGDSDIASLGMVSIMGDDELSILLVRFKTFRCWCGLMALWSWCCKGVELADIGGLSLIIPLEVEVFLVGLLIGEFNGGKAVFEALAKASGKGGDIQVRVLGMSLEEVEP